MRLFPFGHDDKVVLTRRKLKFIANGLFVSVLGVYPLVLPIIQFTEEKSPYPKILSLFFHVKSVLFLPD